MSCSRPLIKPVTLKSCRLESRTLACQKVDAPRTAEAISSDIDGILDDWCLKGKVRSLMTLALLLVLLPHRLPYCYLSFLCLDSVPQLYRSMVSRLILPQTVLPLSATWITSTS